MLIKNRPVLWPNLPHNRFVVVLNPREFIQSKLSQKGALRKSHFNDLDSARVSSLSWCMNTALRLKKNKNLLAFSENEHNILKKNTSIKCSVFSMFVIECISFCSSRVLSVSLFRILPLKPFIYSNKSRVFLSFLFDLFVC